MKNLIPTTILYLAVASIPFDTVIKISVARVTVTEMLFSVAIMMWIPKIVQSQQILRFKPYLTPLLFFLGACVFSLIHALNRLVVMRELLQFMWLFVVFYFFVYAIRDKDQKLLLWSILVLAAGLASCIGIYQYLFLREPINFQVAETRLRAYGTYDQPNAFANFLIGVLPAVFGFYFLHSTQALTARDTVHPLIRILGKRWVIVSLVFVLSTALVATFSRGSWIGMVGGFIVLGYFLRKKHVAAAFAKLIGVVALAAGIIALDLSVDKVVRDRSFSNVQRSLLIDAAFSMFKDYPIFGIGFGNFKDRLSSYSSTQLTGLLHKDYDHVTQRSFFNPNKQPDIELVHNTPLQVAAETGIMGLAAFVWLFLVFYREALKRIRESSSDHDYYFRVIMVTSVTAILGSGMFGWPFTHGIQEVLMMSMAMSVSPHG
ncbi:MAG: O-antigen ligase family protein [Ignavibacteriae bacterium]|nr:O-antigen ligase family protein [Ignavibacteriota bacterium]